MTVGSFLYRQIIPLGSVGIIRPDLHTWQQRIRILGQSVKHIVDDGHGFRTGHLLIRLEGTVGVTADPTVSGNRADLVE